MAENLVDYENSSDDSGDDASEKLLHLKPMKDMSDEASTSKTLCIKAAPIVAVKVI